MRALVRVLALTFALVMTGLTAGAQRTRVSPRHPSPQNPASLEVEQRASNDAEQERIRDLTDRVQKLEAQMIKQSSPSESLKVTIVTALIAAAALLGAAMLGIFGQYLSARREERRAAVEAQRAVELAKQEAIFEHTEKILEFRLKQLEQFYAPMFALLGQSKGLYDKMQLQLAQDEPARYRLVHVQGPGDYPLQVISKDGTWQGFRLLDQLPAVRANPKALALVQGILAIGKQMTEIISKHAGLASEGLIPMLGQYMAHYAILSTIYSVRETEAYEPGWHKMGYYPRELNSKIEEGYRELSQFLDDYTRASKAMLEALPKAQAVPGASG
jgi:hypothetical protein